MGGPLPAIIGIVPGLINLLTPGPQPLDFFIGTSLVQPEVIFGDGSNRPHTPGFEVPEEFGPLGGMQTIASHDFPGGIRTLQQLGAFPETLRWRGILLGNQAFARAATMDRLRVNDGAPLLYLKYGSWLWQGFLIGFRAKARHQWHVDYEAEFEPAADLTSTAAIISSTTPTSILTDLVAELQQFIQTVTGLTPAALSTIAAVLAALVAAGIATDPRLVQHLIAKAVGPDGAVTAMAKDSNPATAALVGDTLSRLLLLGTLFPVAPTIVTQLPAINPNLPAAAAKYLGDQRQWPHIAETNSLLNALPTGVFLQLRIPEPPRT